MQREAFIRGPAKIVIDPDGTPTTINSRGDIRLTINLDSFDVTTDLDGIFDKRASDRRIEISFVPVGDLSAAMLAALYPLANSGDFQGTTVFGAADVDMAIAGKDGREFRLHNIALTQMPELILSSVQTLFGECTFTALGVEDTTWATADSLFTEGALIWAAPTIGTIPTQSYTVAWGASPWDDLELADGGVRISFNQQLEPVVTDRDGTIDYTYGDLQVSANFQPLNVDAAEVVAKAAAIQGVGAGRGVSLAGSDNLVVTNAGATTVVATVFKAAFLNPSFAWGLTTNRIPPMELMATRATSGQALFNITTA